VDAEVRTLIENAHDEAWSVLNDNRDILDTLAHELLERETLDQTQLKEIFAGVKKLPPRPQWLSSTNRPVSDRPPILMPEKAPIDAGATEGAIDSEPKPKTKRAPRRSAPGVAPA